MHTNFPRQMHHERATRRTRVGSNMGGSEETVSRKRRSREGFVFQQRVSFVLPSDSRPRQPDLSTWLRSRRAGGSNN
jgi:hypothetical protein